MKITSCTFKKSSSKGSPGGSSGSQNGISCLELERFHGYDVSMTVELENDMLNGFETTENQIFISTITLGGKFDMQSYEAMEFLKSHKNDCAGISNFIALFESGNDNESDVTVGQPTFQNEQERLREQLQREQERREREQERRERELERERDRLQREQERRQRELERERDRLQREQERRERELERQQREFERQQQNSNKKPSFFQSTNSSNIDLSDWVLSNICPSGCESSMMICVIKSNQYLKIGQLHITTADSKFIYHNVEAKIENGIPTYNFSHRTEQEKSNNIVINVRASLF